MTNETIKLELPLSGLPLRHAGEMLLSMAGELGGFGDAIADTTAGAETLIDPDKEMAAGAGAGDDKPAAVEVDEAELPWDIRINPASRGQIKTGPRKGCWKYKKQLDPELIATVEAELKAAMAVAPPATTEDVPPPPAATEDVPPPPPAGDGTTAATEGVVMDFPTFVQKVTALQGAGRLTAEQCNAAAVTAGLANFMLVANRADLIPTINAEIDRLCPPIQ